MSRGAGRNLSIRKQFCVRSRRVFSDFSVTQVFLIRFNGILLFSFVLVTSIINAAAGTVENSPHQVRQTPIDPAIPSQLLEQSHCSDMSFLGFHNDVLDVLNSGRFFNRQEHDGSYYRKLLSTAANVPILAFFVTLLLMCVPLVTAIYIYASNATNLRENQPKGCRKLGIKTKSNLSNEFDKKFALGWPLSTSEAPAKRWTVHSMWIYPVKSCRGVELDHADIITTGMQYDRQFTFAQLKSPAPAAETEEKKQTVRTWEFITQRRFPRLATVRVEIWVPDHTSQSYDPNCDDVEGGGAVVIRFPYQQPGWRGKLEWLAAILKGSVPEKQFRVPFDPTPSQVQKAGYKYENVVVWKDTVNSLNLEVDVPKELKEYLGVSNTLSLIRVDNSSLRKVYRCAPKAEDLGYQPVTGFQDAYPLHIMNLASVRDLEQKMPKVKGVPSLSAKRFRANIIRENHPSQSAQPYTNCRASYRTRSIRRRYLEESQDRLLRIRRLLSNFTLQAPKRPPNFR